MEAPSTPVQCQMFGREHDMLPTVDDVLQLRAAEPEVLAQRYRAAGMETFASNVRPFSRARTAAEKYPELLEEDYRLYADFLTRAIKLESCVIPPPEQVLPTLTVLHKTQLFDEIIVRTSSATDECLMLGRIKVGGTEHWFKIVQWGRRLTTIEELRKRRRFSRIIGRKLQCIVTWRPSIQLRRSSTRSPLHFAFVTLIASAPVWVFLLPINWWLFAGALGAVLAWSGYYVWNNTRYRSTARWTVGLLIAANIVAAIIAGSIQVNNWATTDRAEEVAVCGIHHNNGRWFIETSKGDRNLENGFYDNTFYPAGTDAPAKRLNGNWVKLTIHGHNLGDDNGGPYVTEAWILRKANCG